MTMYTTQTNGLGGDMGTGTINPAALSSAVTNPQSTRTPDTSPRGVKRSRSPDTYGDLHAGDGAGDNDDSKPRKRGRPMKGRTSGGVPESPDQSSLAHPSQHTSQHPPQSAPPQTPQQQNTGLPPPINTVTPSQVSPPKSTPTKSVVKALPTVRDHTTDQLTPEGDEYIPREYDEAGEQKVSPNGQLLDKRLYRCRTFLVPNRGDKLFMLATECARVLGYRDSYLLFNKNRSLYKIIATQAEKEDLIAQDILPFSYRSRQIAIVTAKSMFRQFGSRVIVNGRRVRDDYWESKARKQGFTEDDLAGEKRPGGAKARDAAAAEASANANAILGHHGDIVYSNAPAHFSSHPQPQAVQPGMMGGPGSGTPLPMIISPENELRMGDFRNMPRPRHEIQGPAYQDRTQPSPTTELLTQAHHAADYSKQVNQQRNVRGKYMDQIWKQPHEPLPSSIVPPPTGTSEHLPPVTQPLQSPHPSAGSLQQPMLSNQGSQHVMGSQSYTQAPHQQNPLAQSPMRGIPQSAMRPDQMSGRSPSLSQTPGGMGQPGNPYAFSSQNMWATPQPQQSSQQGFPGFSAHGSQQTSHLQQSPHQPSPGLRHSTSNPPMQQPMPYPGMQGIPQGYSTPGRAGLYQTDQAQQYIPQNNPSAQPTSQGWSPQHPPGPGNWGWSTQG